MKHQFSNLEWEDFESLGRDLVGREIGLRFEAFTVGTDQGMDGRWCGAEGSVVLQAKHYHRSGFSKLRSKMVDERRSIDKLQPARYILVTSVALTPQNKDALAEIIGPSLQSTGDIFSPEDLEGLLRKFPDIEIAHRQLWDQSAAVLKKVVTEAVKDAITPQKPVPAVLAKLLPPTAGVSSSNTLEPQRDTIFIVKSSPVDDEFTLWLAPKLEAEGYKVFADILTLQPGDRWRREINSALRHRACKVLLLCSDTALADENVQDDIEIALEHAKEVEDPRFVIPLRMEAFRKIKGLSDALPVDFVRGWGEGLVKLLEALQRQRVLRRNDEPVIDPIWEVFRRRGAIAIVDEPERLTSNWLRISEAPDSVRFFESSGVIDRSRLQQAIDAFEYPCALQGTGIIAFADQAEIDHAFADAGRFKLKHEIPILDFTQRGAPQLGLERQDASNLTVAMLKKAWLLFCKRRGLLEYHYSNGVGFHASADQAAIRQLFPWGRQGETRRSSMLRNVAKGHVWQYGVTALPAFWPFWHFKLKSRVLFAVDNGSAAGIAIDDPKKLHRLRRAVCKGWRNKQWYGRMLAFLELLSGESAFIRLPLSATSEIVLEASPLLFSSPVRTDLPDLLDADEEESDASTLGRPDYDEDSEP